MYLVVLGDKGYIIAGLLDWVEGVVDFALHCMAGMDGIPGISFERVMELCSELLLGIREEVVGWWMEEK